MNEIWTKLYSLSEKILFNQDFQSCSLKAYIFILYEEFIQIKYSLCEKFVIQVVSSVCEVAKEYSL